MVTRDGVPLGYEVFAGNRTDVTTVEEIVTMMERRYGQARRVWVMDRGLADARRLQAQKLLKKIPYAHKLRNRGEQGRYPRRRRQLLSATRIASRSGSAKRG